MLGGWIGLLPRSGVVLQIHVLIATNTKQLIVLPKTERAMKLSNI